MGIILCCLIGFCLGLSFAAFIHEEFAKSIYYRFTLFTILLFTFALSVMFVLKQGDFTLELTREDIGKPVKCTIHRYGQTVDTVSVVRK